MSAEPTPPTDSATAAAAVARRNEALERLGNLRQATVALCVAMVLGFSVLAAAATAGSQQSPAAVSATSGATGQSASDEADDGDVLRAPDDDSSGSSYSAPTATPQLPAVVSGGS
jgi:hypothetical protein